DDDVGDVDRHASGERHSESFRRRGAGGAVAIGNDAGARCGSGKTEIALPRQRSGEWRLGHRKRLAAISRGASAKGYAARPGAAERAGAVRLVPVSIENSSQVSGIATSM